MVKITDKPKHLSSRLLLTNVVPRILQRQRIENFSVDGLPIDMGTHLVDTSFLLLSQRYAA
jgi:hypothetical protein